MANVITSKQVLEAARELGQPEFTRSQLATKLGVQIPEMKKGFKQARRDDRFLKVGDDDEGTGLFRLTEK